MHLRIAAAPAIALAQIVVGAPSAARAQEAPAPLAVGARVRATVSPPASQRIAGYRVTGRLVQLDAEHVVIETRGRIHSLPRAKLARLEQPDGIRSRRRGALRGAGVGGAAGFGGGAVVGALTWTPCRGWVVCLSRGENAVLSGVVGGTLGVIVGGAVGAARGREGWRRVDVDADARVGLVFRSGGVGLAFVLPRAR